MHSQLLLINSNNKKSLYSLALAMIVLIQLASASTLHIESQNKPHLQYMFNSTINYNDSNRIPAYDYGTAFMRGFESSDFATNLTQCYLGWVNFYYKELQQLEISLYYADTDDAVYNVTHMISNIGSHMQTCTSFFQGFYYFYYNQKDSYADAADFFISFF